MLTIQNDTVDLMARDITPLVSKFIHQMIPVLSPIEAEQAYDAIARLSTWYGDMSENSVGATVFSTWQFYFYKSLLTQQIHDE